MRCEPGKNTVAAICLDATPPAGDWLPGTLVLTGNAPRKKREFVFLAPSAEPAVWVPQHSWERFHDDVQLTQWQERAFPPYQPIAQAREKKGWLREGEPVFFLCEERMRDTANPDALAFLGRAQMFRLPYDRTPEELLPKELWPADLDLAETMFGVVERGAGGRDGRIIRGRLRFEDAVAQGVRTDWLEPEMIPHILSAPKVTAFAHYLTQDGRQQKDQLTTYIDDDQTTLRGHKWYWHRWDAGNAAGGIAQVRHPQSDQLLPRLRDGGPGMTQLTAIRPVKARVEFSTRVSFDNLSAVELGGLVSALSLPEGCAHKLGMGKPLDLGSVRIVPRLYLVDRPTRYRTWADSGARSGGEEAYTTAFAEAILARARSSGETLLAGRSSLWQIARLETLRLLLQWEQRPPASATQPLALKDFTLRNVLPTPFAVLDLQEPHWNGEPARAAPAPVLLPKARHNNPAPPGPSGSAAGAAKTAGMATPPRGLPANRGDKAQWLALAQPTSKGKPRFQLVGGAMIGFLLDTNPPADPPPGTELELTFWSGGKEVSLYLNPPDQTPKGGSKSKGGAG